MIPAKPGHKARQVKAVEMLGRYYQRRGKERFAGLYVADAIRAALEHPELVTEQLSKPVLAQDYGCPPIQYNLFGGTDGY